MNDFPQTHTIAALAAHVGGTVSGDSQTLIEHVAQLEDASAGALSFVDDRKHFAAAELSQASCLIVPEGATFAAQGATISVRNPKLAFAQVAALLHPPAKPAPQIHPTAVVAVSAQLGTDVFVGPFVCVGENTFIGDGVQLHAGVKIGANIKLGNNCVLHPNVCVMDGVTLGERVVVHAGAVMGADGFGYVRGPAGYVKFPQIGGVEIGDDVEIGANTCVDRGSLGTTRIGRGTKIDNLVQIAHNVEIGENVVIASQTGISGSTVIEDGAIIGGQVGMGDHARVQSGAVIGSKAGVLPHKIVRPGVWWGVPVVPLDEYKRRNAHVGRLPETRAEVKELRRQLEELRQRLDKSVD